MMHFFELLLLSTLSIWGINFCFKKGQIFGFVQEEVNFPKWIWKPLFGCCACMSSIWGTMIFYTSFHALKIPGIIYPVFIICLIGLNHIITALIYDLE